MKERGSNDDEYFFHVIIQTNSGDDGEDLEILCVVRCRTESYKGEVHASMHAMNIAPLQKKNLPTSLGWDGPERM